MSKFPNIEAAIKDANLIHIPTPGGKGYDFRTFAFGERGTFVSNELMTEVLDELTESIQKHFTNYDYIVAPEPGGHTWAFLVAARLNKDLNILRYQPSFSETEIEVARKTGYYQHNLYFNNFKEGDRVLVIDDVLSTGGTQDTILGTLTSLGVTVVGVQAIYAKSRQYDTISSRYNVPIKVLVNNGE